MVAPQSCDEADQIHGEASNLDVDMEGMDHVNEDSLVTDESIDEQRESATATATTEEEEALYDPAECTGDDELQENELTTTVQPEVGTTGCI